MRSIDIPLKARTEAQEATRNFILSYIYIFIDHTPKTLIFPIINTLMLEALPQNILTMSSSFCIV